MKTTGFSSSDRIVEFACLTMVDGRVTHAYDTLIQPGGDPAAHHYGITAEMLDPAPTFQAVAADIAAQLNGAVLVAHNLAFQQRMLGQEIVRLSQAGESTAPGLAGGPAEPRLGAGAGFTPGQGVCTYMLTRQKLSVAATIAGIPQPNHTAKGDAHTVATLLTVYGANVPSAALQAATCHAEGTPGGVAISRSNATVEMGTLQQIANHTAWPGTDETSQVLYLEALDRCLDDVVLDAAEATWLTETAAALRISAAARADLHALYYDLLVDEIMSDGVVTEYERDLAEQVAKALGISREGLKAT